MRLAFLSHHIPYYVRTQYTFDGFECEELRIMSVIWVSTNGLLLHVLHIQNRSYGITRRMQGIVGLAWQTDVLHANNHSLSNRREAGAGGGACDVANCRSSLTVCSFKFVVASFYPLNKVWYTRVTSQKRFQKRFWKFNSQSHAQLFAACPTASDVRQATKSWAWDCEQGYTVPERGTPTCRENLSLQLTSVVCSL